ncbi:MAG TPA: hypothetical protein DCS87_00700 [Rheinheimera sp.]|nr:hypothetical protein [Rheinheimera sp.]
MRLVAGFLLMLLASCQAQAGAWGHGAFENDAAMDWVDELTQSKHASVLLQSFNNVVRSHYVELDYCGQAIASAEVIAAFKTGDFQTLPAELSAWARAHNAEYEPEMAKLAFAAVAKCQQVQQSEIAQLWHEADASGWLLSLAELQKKLQ